MKVTYIGHSGFSLELEQTVFLFDYYTGVIPEFDRGKHLFVFASHKHADHFNFDIFNLADKYPKITFVLGSDIHMNETYMERKHIPVSARPHIVRAKKDSTFTLPSSAGKSAEIQTLISTDEGVAFVIRYDGRTFYHAGDLNWWSWEGESDEDEKTMEDNFKREIEKIRGTSFDLAFVPLDPRQEGERFSLGMDWFMRATNTKVVFPMHCWDDYTIIDKFLSMDCTKDYRDRVVRITGTGQSFEV